MVNEDGTHTPEEVIRILIGGGVAIPENGGSVKGALRKAEANGVDGVEIADKVHERRLKEKPHRGAPFGNPTSRG